jgi:membrane protease YdiL (CAAX protease family)
MIGAAATEGLAVAVAGLLAAAILTLADVPVPDNPAPFGALFGILAIPAYALSGRRAEGRDLGRLGLPRHPAGRPLGGGLLLGALLMTVTVAVLALSGSFEAKSWSEGAALGVLALLPAAVLDACWQEILARGIVFRHLETMIGSVAAVAVSTFFFALIHVTAPHATLLSCLAIGLQAGPLLAAVFVLTRNLWATIGIHAGWNYMGGAVFGVPISGNEPAAHLIDQGTTGSTLWTGGVIGPEGGLVATTVCLSLGLLLLLVAQRRGLLQNPGAGTAPAPTAASR